MQDTLKLEKRIKTAKTTIIIVAVLTIINSVLIALNADVSFTFSAFIPQLITAVFAEIAIQEGVGSILYIGLAIAVFMSLIYLGLWFGAKKKNEFIVAALVLFSVDTIFLLFSIIRYFDAGFIIDIFFHGWVIYDLILGVASCSKLSKMPAQYGDNQQYSADESNQTFGYNTYPQNADADNVINQPDCFSPELCDSTPIGISENKGRALISADYNGMNIEVRRSKGLTELIIDGKVYAEKKGVIETEYSLDARVSGVNFSAVMTLQSVMILFADGQQIAKKIRII